MNMSLPPEVSNDEQVKNALLGLIFQHTKSEDAVDSISNILLLAEQLIEHAGYSGAGILRGGDVTELMLISARLGRLAENLKREDCGPKQV